MRKIVPLGLLPGSLSVLYKTQALYFYLCIKNQLLFFSLNNDIGWSFLSCNFRILTPLEITPLEVIGLKEIVIELYYNVFFWSCTMYPLRKCGTEQNEDLALSQNLLDLEVVQLEKREEKNLVIFLWIIASNWYQICKSGQH